jgi:hypothetical protein
MICDRSERTDAVWPSREPRKEERAHDDPMKVELQLNRYLPAAGRGGFSLRMILHGPRVCLARPGGAAEVV